MPDLTQSLHGRDLGHLRIVARLWGISLQAASTRQALQLLSSEMHNPEQVQEMIELLPVAARQALDDLLANGGRLAWSLFVKRYGAVREMGPARRDRERPYEKDSSVSEQLWYRALAARGFFDTPEGPREFAYIPDDLLPVLPAPDSPEMSPLGRQATPGERAQLLPANDFLLDHACTLLAALRSGIDPDEMPAWETAYLPYPPTIGPVRNLLKAASLLDEKDQPQLEPVRTFLEAPRSNALLLLFQAWMRSATGFNELRMLPGLLAEGDWRNDPLAARQRVLGFIRSIPPGTWWSLPALLSDIRRYHPDFQRPAGDYDSWFLREKQSGEFLRGFEHWDRVDGELVRFILCGPLHWFGVLDLAAPALEAPVSAFRLTSRSTKLFADETPEGLPEEEQSITARSDGLLDVHRLAPRAVRYQLARFAEWLDEGPDRYRYRLTPTSLERARRQDLQVGHLLSLLRKHAAPVPPSLVKALQGWEARGSQARFEQVTVLRLGSPEILAALRASRAARFLEEPLGPTSVVVRPGAIDKVMAVLFEMGYLAEVKKKAPE